jgi:prevent-host-death family protein
VKPVSSDDARRRFRELIDDVAHRGEHVMIMRWKTPAAVIVPIKWYEQVTEELAHAHAEASAREGR